MRRSTFVPIGLVATALALGACGSDASERKPAPTAADAFRSAQRPPGYEPGMYPVGGADKEPNDGLVVEHARGALEQRDVDRTLERHVRQLVACYERAGQAQRYAAGDVVLKFFVSSMGDVSNVLVTSTALGNWAVERCLVDEGKRIRFPAPGGGKATDFEYSLNFRSSGEVAVVDWESDVLAKEVGTLAPQLGTCGKLGPGTVKAVAYIEPSGGVASVGLASEEPLDGDAAACVVDQIQKWRVPTGAGRGHMVRTSFSVQPLNAAPSRPEARRLVKKTPRRQVR
jgi:hypothetical protein